MILLIFSGKAFCDIYYTSPIFSQVHNLASTHSETLAVLDCGTQLEAKKDKKLWVKVQIEKKSGFILRRLLSKVRPNCIQDNYPYFFSQMSLDPVSKYYWGKLYDYFYEGNTL